MKRIIAQARKELTQIFRDRLTVALALVLPLILLALLGTALSFSVKGIAVVVQDFDQTALSRRYIDALNASLTFRVKPLSSEQRPDEALMAERARAVVEAIWPHMLALVGFAVALVGISAWRFRKQLG